MEDEGIGIKARLVSMLLRLLTLGLIAVALMISTEGIVIVVLLFVLVVPFEKLFPRHRGQKVRRPHLDTDVGYALASPLMGLLTGFVAIAIGLLSLAWIPGLLVAPYVAKIPEAYFAGGWVFAVRRLGVLDPSLLSRDSRLVEISRHPSFHGAP